MKVTNIIERIQEKSLVTLSHYYLELVAKTSTINIKGEEYIEQKTIVGYWHGDSYTCQLLLRHEAKKQNMATVIVTADRRGDYITRMLQRYHAKTVRAQDGFGMRHAFQEILTTAKEEDGLFAGALDGPLGPYHEPKKLIFYLAEEARKKMIFLHIDYQHCLTIKKRWDQYKIPLPFRQITITIIPIGMISKSMLKDFKSLSNRIE